MVFPFLVLLVFGIDFCKSAAVSCKLVDYYEKLILEEEKRVKNYVLDTDARRYIPKSEQLEDIGFFDFIVIGAGASGTVVANRLSENGKWSILLLEAGEFGNNFTQIPSMNTYTKLSDYNWGYQSVPQKYACQGMVNKVCPYPRGRGVGGTTLINGLVYARGNPKDYDNWAALGNPGWSYNEVLPYFLKSENFVKNDANAPVDPAYHGKGGYLNNEYHLPESPQLKPFLEANKELGYDITDINSPKQIGASPSQLNIKNGLRHDAGAAYIDPIKNRMNLKILTESFVTKILINEKTKVAQSVLFSQNGRMKSVHAKMEVILSAGAIGSPQILLLSGIGPSQHLKDIGIPVIQNLEVGSTFHEHPLYYGLTFSTNYSEPIKPLRTYIKEWLNGLGPLAYSGNDDGISFYQSTVEKTPNFPDIELQLITANTTNELWQRNMNWNDETNEATWAHTNPTNSLALYLIALHAHSIGTLRLKSSNPYDYPLIDPNLLSKARDVQTIYEGIQLALKLTQTDAMRKINTTFQVRPHPACKQYEFMSKGYWYCSIRQLTYNVYHPIGTNPMGPYPSKGGVVDAKLKVHGIRNLRIVDASVFPFTFSGHPNAYCVMLGEKASDIIKSDNGMVIK